MKIKILRQEAGDCGGGTFSSAHILNEILPRLDRNRGAAGKTQTSTGLSSGIPELDSMIDGFHPGELIVVAARPGMGAQEFVWKIALHVACELKQPVAYFSAGKSRNLLLQNMVAYSAGLRRFSLRKNDLSHEEWQDFTATAHEIFQSPLFINDRSADPRVIRKEAKSLFESGTAPSLIVVDSIPERDDSESQIGQRLSRMSAEVFRLARENDVPVIALAGISGDVEEREDKHPKLADVASADGLHWFADTVISPYCSAVYYPEKDGEPQDIGVLKSFYGCIGGFEIDDSLRQPLMAF